MALLPLLQSTAGLLSPTDFTDMLIANHWITDWGPVAIYSLLISLFVVVLAYLVAEILRSPQLNAWAKNELHEFIISALIVANLFVGLTIMNAIVSDMTHGLDHFGVANDYLDTLSYSGSVEDFTKCMDHVITGAPWIGKCPGSLVIAYTVLSAYETISGILGSLYIQLLVAGPRLFYIKLGMVPIAGLEQFTLPILSLTDMVGIVLMATLAQKALLTFFKESMFSLFLPLGIVLRAFPLSRKLGATIIAVAVTCYVVYPLTLVMDQGIYDSVPKKDVSDVLNFNAVISNMGCNLGAACTKSGDCCNAPCVDQGAGPVCQNCPPFRTACINDTDPGGCGLYCMKDPNGGYTYQFFTSTIPDAAYGVRSHTTDPTCIPPNPNVCKFDWECLPCSGQCPTCTGKCILQPDAANPGSTIGYCAYPDVGVAEFLNTVNTPPDVTLNCDQLLGKCYNTNNMNKGEAAQKKFSWLQPDLIEYIVFPFGVPQFFFKLLTWTLPYLLWPVVGAVILAITDIVICITFFRSLSETLGGESSILGLSKVM